MRKSLTVLFTLCALVAVAAGQAAGEKRDAPGIAVVGFEWKYDGYARVEVVRSGKSSTSIKMKRGVDYVFKYLARVTVRNDGAKAIKAVEWDYFFDDPEGGKELKRYRLQSKQQIAPGSTQKLTKDVFIQPDDNTRHINAGKQRVQITRVEFGDGSVWRLEDEKKP
ncbi:MAG: hypothetical protein H7Z38_01620 [Rubrivivax sp.]|nr:hypothetical protein [Pyrinomonadaceae bacterium]